jgi:hypothetical protein
VSGGGIPDDALLAAIRAMYDRLDPPPPDLTERVRFALSLENLEVELLRMEQELLAGAGARGEERARTVTFSSQSLAVMVTLAEDAGGTRIDGWIAGGGGLRVELRRPGSARRAHADGIVQLVFTPMPGAALDLQVPVVTPAIEI